MNTKKSFTLKKYDLIASEIRQNILSGQWAVGTKLPIDAELAQRFDCSLGTISKALGILAHEGLLERRSRVGTTVIKNALDNNLPAMDLNAFAVIYPSDQHEGIFRISQGFQIAARLANRRLLMLTTGIDFKQEVEIIGRLSEFNVKGALIYPLLCSALEMVDFSHALIRSKFPVVLVEADLLRLGCPTVAVNSFHAGYTMTRHILAKGAKKIGFFSNDANAPSIHDRYRGYAWAMQEAGIAKPEKGVFLESSMHPNFNNPLEEPTRLAEAFLKKSGPLDAVVCANDFLAVGCINAAKKLGIRVPGDMLVSGIDDIASLARSAGVALTTYHIPFEEIGSRAFALLTQIVSGGAPYVDEGEIRGEIVVRESA